ncbi:hypothetical protein IW261DRAFT_1418664 [Armillaria novae-zelandiae]|uniref:CN hydrolase domain-containing protein n=1 Tax=Armillaria novae-zelandiae TaxID=153914 RepID=A0AA39PE30_9AGAR|nr:hypothetical protein IW261DRAFT_1418664 [Armillaria novae-zelandiae]
MSARRLILIDHPHLIFNALAFGTAVLATASATLIPTVLHLSTLLVYSTLLVNRRDAVQQAALWINLSLAKFIILLAPAIHALSSPASSLALLFLGGSITSAITLATLYTHIKLRSRVPSPWSQIMLFPALWAAVWWGVSSVSPIGRLASWAPVIDTMGYSWMLKLTGPVMDDWIAAAWAVVLSEMAGAWLMGSKSLGEEEPLLGNRVTSSEDEEAAAASSMPSWRCVVCLTTLLAALTIPSFIVSDVALPVYSSDTTPFSVGCILPKRRDRQLRFEDYLQETKKLDGKAEVLLWPEGAVTFRDESERAAALAQIQESIRGSHVGVSFEESLPNRFPLVHSITPATIYTMSMKNPSDVKKPDWAPPPFTRPVPLTASICLDFAFPGTLAALESRPALILAPARTWEPTVGLAMWEQAKRRAAELDSTVLWCDGGDGGVSGVSGRGITEVTQVGEGSWVRSIGVEYPFNDKRTVYGVKGNSGATIFIGIMFMGGFAMFIPLPGLGNLRVDWVKEGFGRFESKERASTVSVPRVMIDTGHEAAANCRFFSYRRIHRLFSTSLSYKNKSKGITASLKSIQSRFARRPRGSLRNSPRNSRPGLIQLAAGTDDDGDDAASSFFVVTAADLPISLDSPQQLIRNWSSDKPNDISATPCSTSPPSVVNNVSVLNRLRNYSRVSILPSQKRLRQRLPFPTKNGSHTSGHILDDFPEPPSHIPTPTGATSVVNFVPRNTSSVVSVNTAPETPKKQRIFSTERFKALTKRAKWRRRQPTPSPLHELPVSIEKPLPPTPTEESDETLPPVITYCLVSPVELTASPSPRIGLDLCDPSARASFIPPSPSWLSRNLPAPYRVPSHDSTDTEDSAVPASPPPLPIPPRLSPTDSPPLSPLEVTSWLTHLESFKFSRNTSSSSLNHYRSLSRRSSVKSISAQSSFFTYSASEKENQLYSSQLSLKHPVLAEDRQIFIPTTHPDTDTNYPTDLFTAALKGVFTEARGHIMNMDLYGKTGEVVDFGGEADYSGTAWFQDPPPQRATPVPQSVGTPYVPDPDVIAQNEAFEFALSAAPNVLYARYKQYGQLGVLAWCSEFGELIDNLKEMGFAGNMFVSTRSQALKTCEEILRLRLTDVKMQIIIMYLSSQVSRLRRFLDGDGVWDDYPELTFPLEPMKHQATS